MSEAPKKAVINKPESAVLPTIFEPMSRLEQDMERMFHEFWRRPFLSLGSRTLMAGQDAFCSDARSGCL